VNDEQLFVAGSRDTASAFRVTFRWMGTAHSVPMAERRLLVDLATAAVEQARAACSPAAPPHPECVAIGFGGHAVCRWKG
jgi:hypothetical protein